MKKRFIQKKSLTILGTICFCLALLSTAVCAQDNDTGFVPIGKPEIHTKPVTVIGHNRSVTLALADEDYYRKIKSLDGTKKYHTYKKINLSVYGKAAPNSKVIISWVHRRPSNNWTVAGNAHANKIGNWSIDLNLDPGHYNITAGSEDSAGNLNVAKSPIILDIKQALIIVVMDGAADSGNIFKTTRAAATNQAIVLKNSKNYAEMDSSFTGFGADEVNTGMRTINSLAGKFDVFGINKSDIKLVIIGKSLGAAKTYKMLHRFAYDLNDYEKVAVVFVDTHCVPPSDEGDGGWNNYVYFTGESGNYNSTYNMAWLDRWTSAFNSPNTQRSTNSKLRIYNIYSRRCYKRTPILGNCMKLASILGYSFSSAHRNLHARDWKGYSYNGVPYLNNRIYNLQTERHEKVSHFNIDKARETRNLIEEAILGILKIGSSPED